MFRCTCILNSEILLYVNSFVFKNVIKFLLLEKYFQTFWFNGKRTFASVINSTKSISGIFYVNTLDNKRYRTRYYRSIESV